jgi:hypothetical protein
MALVPPPALLTAPSISTAALLTALSRSRHFRPSESAVAPEIGSPTAARRSQFQ